MPDRLLGTDLLPTLLRSGDSISAMTVVHAMHKHALQMVLQHQTPSGDNPPSTNGNMKKDVT
jgi:DNA repair protein RadC